MGQSTGSIARVGSGFLSSAKNHSNGFINL